MSIYGLADAIAKAFKETFTINNPLPTTGSGGGGGIASSVSIRDGSNALNTLGIASDGSIKVLDNLGVPTYNYVAASPSFDNTTGTTTITYRQGGASGTIVAIIVLTYDEDSNLITVQRS